MNDTAETESAATGSTSPGSPGREIEDLSFEEAYEELERVVAAMEEGEQPLEEAIALYERGIALTERCNELLAEVELRVRAIDEEGRDAGEVQL
jgi:exodeoxyribonuclease VII small subunit